MIQIKKIKKITTLLPLNKIGITTSIENSKIYMYIYNANSKEFLALKGIGQLAEKIVEMKKIVSYPLVYSLVTLTLILPVATAIVEIAFSAMSIIKN